MSKVSTWVQAEDNKFYQNPVLYGSDWYLCFDDDDPPEVVVKCTVKREAKKLASERLRGAGVKFKWLPSEDAVQASGRFFPPAYTGSHKAFSYFLDLLEPLPIPATFEPALLTAGVWGMKFDGLTDYPSTECVFLAFSVEFEVADVSKLFLGQLPGDYFLNFFEVAKNGFEAERRKLQKQVLKQYPSLRGTSMAEDSLRGQLGDKVRLRK